MKKKILTGLVFSLYFLSFSKPKEILYKNNVKTVYKSPSKRQIKTKDDIIHEFFSKKNKNNPDLENKIEKDINKHLESILYLHDKKNNTYDNFYSKKTVKRINKYSNIINFYSKKYSISPNLIKAIIAVESKGKETVKSPSGAKGLMQLIDSTAKKYSGNTDIFDPKQNIRAGTRYLRFLYTKYNTTEEVLIHYNTSPNGVNKAKKRAKNNNYWVYKDYFIGKEPKEYVPKVLAWKRFFEYRLFNKKIVPKGIKK